MGRLARMNLSVSDASYWNLLGIDVWVSARGITPSGSRVTTSTSIATQDQSTQHAGSDQGHTLVQGRDLGPAISDGFVRTSMQCFILDGVFVVISDDALASSKIVIDIARSVNFYRSNKHKNYTFQWPQTESADNNFDSMVRAFENFLNSQNAKNNVLISAGEIANTVSRVQSVISKTFVISRVPNTGKEKRILWEQIEKL